MAKGHSRYFPPGSFVAKKCSAVLLSDVKIGIVWLATLRQIKNMFDKKKQGGTESLEGEWLEPAVVERGYTPPPPPPPPLP